MTYIKKASSHAQAAAAEAAGLSWLSTAEAAGGPRVVRVLKTEPRALHLERIVAANPSESAAAAFGAALGRMHQSLWPEPQLSPTSGSAPLFGALPPDHPTGVAHLFGPADQLLELGTERHHSWGAFHCAERLQPVLQALDSILPSADTQLLRAAQERIGAGFFDHAEPASLIHGDLWSGNVLWADEGAVLIDPAAHAGHREADLAMLQLFGLPHLDSALDAYQQTVPLTDGWQDRVPVHQLFFLAVHLLLFGPAYRAPTLEAAEKILSLRG